MPDSSKDVESRVSLNLNREDQAIRSLLEATASATGADFYRALVKGLAEVLGTSAAWVTEYVPAERRLRALAMWSDGRYVDGYEYAIAGTPCEPVIASCGLAHFEQGVVDLFPRDPDLPLMNAVSYIGAPFVDTSGKLLGHVAAIDTKAMPKRRALFPVVELFAARAGAEYEREQIESKLREREGEMARLLETALDGILVLNGELIIERVNPAAQRIFGCAEEDLIGESMLDFMSPRGAEQVRTLADKLTASAECGDSVWIAEGLEAMRWNREIFPVEATLSRFEFDGKERWTLILRNIEERLEAKKRIDELSREAEYLRSAIDQVAGSDVMIGDDESMRRVFDGIERVARTDASVLILGETGTGKELVARRIHFTSLRRSRPMVCVNCGSVPESLMESEFFGHEKGAFTGAAERRIGRFERAHGGTLFLDEIGEMPLALQAKLLRVLQEGEFERVGGSEVVKVDLRVIAATHRDLEAMVAEGSFRKDLYYRLNVFPLHLPPLRERKSDIPLLASAFIERVCAKMGRAFDPMSESDRDLLIRHDWPGNARELQNVIERAIIQSRGRTLQIAQAMPPGAIIRDDDAARGEAPSERAIFTEAQMRAFEMRNIRRALVASNGAIFGPDGAAARLGVKPTTLASRIKKLGITRDRLDA